jgi:hypothetical protein
MKIKRRVVSKQTDVSEMRTASITVQMMEAVRTSETSIYFKTRRYIPEGCHLPTRRLITQNLTQFSLLFNSTFRFDDPRISVVLHSGQLLLSILIFQNCVFLFNFGDNIIGR